MINPNKAFKDRNKPKRKHSTAIIFDVDHDILNICPVCKYQYEFVFKANANVPFSTKNPLCPECREAYMNFYFAPIKSDKEV